MGAGRSVEAAGINIREEALGHTHVETFKCHKGIRYVFVLVKHGKWGGIDSGFGPRSLWMGGRYSGSVHSGRHDPWRRFS